jgi:lambda repressor-like predicted transcriptional regulator
MGMWTSKLQAASAWKIYAKTVPIASPRFFAALAAPKWHRAKMARHFGTTRETIFGGLANRAHGHYTSRMAKLPILLDLLKQRDITLAELARNTGLSPSFLSRLANNHRWPGLHAALKVARALGVHAETIWGETTKRPIKRRKGH